MASKITRITLVSFTDKKSTSSSIMPQWTGCTVCSTVPRLCRCHSPHNLLGENTDKVYQNYHQEAAIIRQINLEFYASYIYLSMSFYFGHDDVALKNFVKYFLHQSHEEREHTEKRMKLQNQ
ncbi:Ferritin heavy chain [Tupaia chinensis]|uniref:Ferritin n=1 Tax=Tupaia chinensis TaxID=246437 RepID=L9KPS2_TUPCH|nr:Ferritin heavy chain [Tupaia chinensis]